MTGFGPPRRAPLSGARCAAAAAMLVVAALAFPGSGGAQSLLAGAGLGVPIDPFDARTRALGSVGVGLSGWALNPTDPAATAGLTLPAIMATFQPTTATLSDGRSAGHARFPIAGVSYPYAGHVFSAQFTSFLDQGWEVQSTRTIEVGGAPVSAQDRYISSGGVGQFRLGWARRLGEPLAVGLNVGSYIGSVERSFLRVLDPAGVGPGVELFAVGGQWRASGTTAAVGAIWDPSALVRLSGSATWSSGLTLSPSGGDAEEEGEYAIPLDLRIGGTFTAVTGLRLTVGVGYADWTATGEDLGQGTTRDAAWSYGGGIEWTQMSLRDRTVPVRLGYRQTDLPFHFDGEPASERTLSGGLGVYLVETEVQPVARLEVGLERGERTAGALSESFWRTTVSVRLAGG